MTHHPNHWCCGKCNTTLCCPRGAQALTEARAPLDRQGHAQEAQEPRRQGGDPGRQDGSDGVIEYREDPEWSDEDENNGLPPRRLGRNQTHEFGMYGEFQNHCLMKL